MSNKEIGIYELIKGIREDFMRIQNDPEIQKDPIFAIKSFEIELNVAISKAAEAGVKFFVVTAGGEYKTERINKITIALEPLIQVEPKKVRVEASGKPYRIRGRRPIITAKK